MAHIEYMKECRESAGLTMTQVANAIGIGRHTYAVIEGGGCCKVEIAKRVAHFYRKSMDYIWGHDDHDKTYLDYMQPYEQYHEYNGGLYS